MADRVQAYNQASVPWMPSHSDGPTEGHSADLDRRPHRAATSPAPSTSSTTNPYIGQAAFPPSLYPGRRPPNTVHNSDIYFSSGMNNSNYDPRYSSYSANYAPHNPAQFYPAHQQQYFASGLHNYSPHQMRSPSPLPPPAPVPPKPPALQQEVRHDGRHAPLHPSMYRSFTSPPPVPPKPSLLFQTESSAIPTSAYLGNHSSAVNPSVAATTTPPRPPLPPGAPAAETTTPRTPATHPQENDDGDDLAVALALSKDESLREEERLKELTRLEELEFERALAASMQSEDSRGGYDFYESQPGAGPSNWVATGPSQASPSSPPIYPSDEVGPSASSSSSKGSSKAALEPSSAGKSKLDEPAPKSREKEPVVEIPAVSSPQPAKRRSLDDSVPNGTSSHEHEDDPLPRYSPDIALAASSPLPSSPPDLETSKPEIPKETEENDYDGDDLPYLRGTRENLSVSIPAAGTSAASKRRLSPVSASFIDLSYDDSYIDEDEALARRLADEETEAALQENQQSQQAAQVASNDHISCNTSASSTSDVGRGKLPTYSDAISFAPSRKSSVVPEVVPSSRKSSYVPDVRVESPAAPAQSEKADLARNRSLNSVASEPMPNSSLQSDTLLPSNGPQAITLQPDEPQRVIGRVVSMSALPGPSRAPVDDEDPPPLSEDELATPINPMYLNPKAVHLTVASANSNDCSAGPSSVGVLNANHFVDAELLHGVSINFSAPVVTAKLTPMQGTLPTLISLPYGRCPSLHFQTPSWRHALKLMARLSGTKIEPSIEALAVTKNEPLKLRTVIQFIKPHHMSYEWRTILWFTIDHPVPPNIPNAQKYQVNNPNVLPFSYTLSTTPAVLRDAADTMLSKTYTVPATVSVPYPLLPITLPNLALYLQAALDDSRRQNDSSPLSKLAKMVQTCYPNDLVVNDAEEEPEKYSSGVSGLFKKVIGRGGKKVKKGGAGNEDTYDLVTPFVPDEWG